MSVGRAGVGPFLRPSNGDVSVTRGNGVIIVTVGGVKHLSLSVEQADQLAKLLPIFTIDKEV